MQLHVVVGPLNIMTGLFTFVISIQKYKRTEMKNRQKGKKARGQKRQTDKRIEKKYPYLRSAQNLAHLSKTHLFLGFAGHAC